MIVITFQEKYKPTLEILDNIVSITVGIIVIGQLLVPMGVIPYGGTAIVAAISLIGYYMYRKKRNLTILKRIPRKNGNTPTKVVQFSDSIGLKDDSRVEQLHVRRDIIPLRKIGLRTDQKEMQIKSEVGKEIFIKYSSNKQFSIIVVDKWHRDRSDYYNARFFEDSAISGIEKIHCRKNETLYLIMWANDSNKDTQIEFEVWIE